MGRTICKDREIMMEQLLCHLVGDYVLQNHWMATNKVKAWIPAIIHATLYMLPFLLLTHNAKALFMMWLTHLLIDRFRLAKYWVEFWGVGNTGDLWNHEWNVRRYQKWNPTDGEYPCPQPKDRAPDFLAVWLLIIVDNTLHLTINYFSLKYL